MKSINQLGQFSASAFTFSKKIQVINMIKKQYLKPKKHRNSFSLMLMFT